MLESAQSVPPLSTPSHPVPIPPPVSGVGAGDASVAEWPANHPGSSPSSSIRYRVLDRLERYDEILELRRAAFGATHHASTRTVDPRDRQASMIAALSGSRIIAALRLAPPLPGPLFHPTTRFEGPLHELPLRSTLLESSRACIHPDHRGQGLFWQLAAEMVLAADALGKTHLVGGADSRLLGFWTRCGYEATSITYGYPGGSIQQYRVVVLEVAKALQARDIAPELERALAARH